MRDQRERMHKRHTEMLKGTPLTSKILQLLRRGLEHFWNDVPEISTAAA